MKAAAWVMSDEKRFAAAQKGLAAGRLLARKGQITTLPFPMSAWTGSRNIAAPPKQTSRQWFAETHGDPEGSA
jgi:L-lactate dehydrogenase complex protein LldF